MAGSVAELSNIRPDKIVRNKDNPRLVFREDDMRELQESIAEVGIRVPITVYPDGNKFVLIDGERRWRSSKKLNLEFMPAIVQPKPNRLENILMMFNIHNVRVDWDLMPMALKLQDVKGLLERTGEDCSPRSLAGMTGMKESQVKRALELLDLPKKYRDRLISEAEKPRGQQTIKADLFVEIHKAYATILKYQPLLAKEVSRAKFRDTMVDKYLDNTAKSVTEFRLISKIARGERAGGDKKASLKVLRTLVRNKKMSATEAYDQSVGSAYAIRDLNTRTVSLIKQLSAISQKSEISSQLAGHLKELQVLITKLIGKA